MVTSACLSLSVLGPVQPQHASAYKDCVMRFLDWSWSPLSKSHRLQMQIEIDCCGLISGKTALPLQYRTVSHSSPNQGHRLERRIRIDSS